MKTKLFLLTGLISAGVMISSCQKDNEFERTFEQSKGTAIPADMSKPGGSLTDYISKVTLTNYPDPFVDKTNIQFTLKGATLIRIYIHEMSTHKSELFFEGWRGIGTHVVVFDARGREPGEYIAELFAGNTVVKESMFKLKDDIDDLNDNH